MGQEIERVQETRLGHRTNFWGRTVSYGTVAWNYRLQTWRVERPADGERARRTTVTCFTCGRTLTYKIYSVAATRRRQLRGLIAVLLVAVLSIAPLIVMALRDSGFDVLMVACMLGCIPGFIVGFGLLWAFGGEQGIAGHGSWVPGYAKHKVFLPGDPGPGVSSSTRSRS